MQALRRRRLLVKGVFEDAYQYMKSGTLLRQVVNKIQTDVDFNDATGRHLFGDIYERILRDLQGAGNAGEYYTPRAVTQFAVDMIDPRLGESILDPACGTGGFLACAIEHVRRQDVKTPRQEAQLQASIRGVEKKPLPHLLCATNMIVHGIDVPAGIVHDNTLSRPLRDLTLRDRVDVVLTNPPFGGMEEDGIENNFPAEFRTRGDRGPLPGPDRRAAEARRPGGGRPAGRHPVRRGGEDPADTSPAAIVTLLRKDSNVPPRSCYRQDRSCFRAGRRSDTLGSRQIRSAPIRASNHACPTSRTCPSTCTCSSNRPARGSTSKRPARRSRKYPVKSSPSFRYRFRLSPNKHRIVAKVDELMGLLDRLEETRERRDAAQSAYVDASLHHLTA